MNISQRTRTKQRKQTQFSLLDRFPQGPGGFFCICITLGWRILHMKQILKEINLYRKVFYDFFSMGFNFRSSNNVMMIYLSMIFSPHNYMKGAFNHC